jgi:predicted phage tail protein
MLSSAKGHPMRHIGNGPAPHGTAPVDAMGWWALSLGAAAIAVSLFMIVAAAADTAAAAVLAGASLLIGGVLWSRGARD